MIKEIIAYIATILSISGRMIFMYLLYSKNLLILIH